MAKILVVDDEQAILVMIRKILAMNGHDVVTCEQSMKVPEMDLSVFDLIILDVMMPDKDGFTLCQEIRASIDCPILFLTAKTDENGIVEGLMAGADDYIAKPFGKKELIARVNAHLRRERREKVSRISFSECYFNLSSKELYVREKAISLTKTEYLICEYLAKHPGQVFSREQIYEAVFGLDGDSFDSTIAMHVKNIRTKLEAVNYAPIKTVWGIGYKWEAQ